MAEEEEVTHGVGVVGAGTMGVGIAYVFAAAGCETTVVEPDAERARALMTVVETQAERGVARGKMSPATAALLPSLVTSVASVEELPEGLSLVVESVPERLPLKLEVLGAAEKRGAQVLATNTSALSIDDMAASLERADTFLGLHFFNPVWSLGLVEIVCGSATSRDTVDRAQRLVELIGKKSIVVRDVPGFATSRLDLVSALEAMRMLESGVASADDIDTAVTLAYRHPVGPLRLSDIVGLDVRLDIAHNLSAVYGERFQPPRILLEKVAAGELGRKTGRGFFDWPETRG